MVTSDQIVGRPRTECAVTSILTESATTPVNWYTSVIVQIKPLIIDFIRTPPTFIRTCADECGNPIP